MIGYDPLYANAEMKRLFFTINESNGFNNDHEVIDAVESMISSTNVAVANASCAPHDLSDKDEGAFQSPKPEIFVTDCIKR